MPRKPTKKPDGYRTPPKDCTCGDGVIAITCKLHPGLRWNHEHYVAKWMPDAPVELTMKDCDGPHTDKPGGRVLRQYINLNTGEVETHPVGALKPVVPEGAIERGDPPASKLHTKIGKLLGRGTWTDADRVAIARLALNEIAHLASRSELRDIAVAALRVVG